jgi:two-component system NarL family sensor kinase
MANVLTRFAKTLPRGDDETLAHVRDYVEWNAQREGGDFSPADGDDVALRTYLLELRIAGVPRRTLEKKVAALKQFYAWALSKRYLEISPFDEFNFDRPFLTRDQIRRRHDTLGTDPTQRELNRLRALNRLAEQLSRATDLRTALDVALQTLVETMGLHTAWAFLWEKSGLTTYLHHGAEPHGAEPHDFVLGAACALPPGLEQDHRRHLRDAPDCQCQWLLRDGLLKRAVNVVECTRLQTAAHEAGDTKGLLFHATVPLIAHGQPVGLINIAADEWQFFSAGDLQLLTAAGAQIAAAIERAGLFARSTELGAVEERNRLAREIHDTLAQGLTAITLQLETADALLEAGTDPARARATVQQALSLARANLEEARRSVLDLRAAPLEGRTLSEALEALVKAASAQAGKKPSIKFELRGPARPLPPRVEVNLYRIAQEALNNVLQHARAKHAVVRLALKPGQAQLLVEDDGVSFDSVEAPKGRFGLLSMNERARLAGGSLHVESAPGRGTRVEVTVPLTR